MDTPISPFEFQRMSWRLSLRDLFVHPGDILLAIDNQTIQGVETFAALVNLLKPHQKITIAALDHKTGQTGMVQIMVR